MNKKESSILQQKARGTYKRNELIRLLHSQGENFAWLGKQFRMSRQAVRKICNGGSE